jgi:hypothetical protein
MLRTMTDHERIIAETRAWVNRAVIGLNLCPFAKAVEVKRQIRYTVTDAVTPEALCDSLRTEIHRLLKANPAEIETTLLIHPQTLTDFLDYNEFLAVADATVTELGAEGILQIASFHPQYQFAGTTADALSNATNRSPYPTLHLLRESSISRAVAAYPDPDSIFETNIRTLEALGREGWHALRAQCRKDAITPGDALSGGDSGPTVGGSAFESQP